MSYDNWINTTIDEVSLKVFSGGTPSTKNPAYWNGSMPWLSSGETRNNYITETEKTITQEGVEGSSTRLAQYGDIVIASAGQGFTRGQTSICKIDTYINQSIVAIRCNPEIAHEMFVYYNIKNRYNELRAISDGHSIRGSLTTKLIKGLDISLPPLLEQKAISNVLSSLDDKIELNNKINKNLEEIAQALYKRWFVDFEFPNEDGEPYKSSGGEMIESELGLIPKGWDVGSLGLSSISKLLTSGINDFYNKKVYIATADVTNSTITSFETLISQDEKPSRANMQPKTNTVWFAKMKDSRKLIRVSESNKKLIDNCIFSTGFAGINCINSLNYIWTYILSDQFDITKNNLCNGTTMQAINNTSIKLIKLLIPRSNVLSKFETLTDNMFERIRVNNIQNEELSKTRDTLLPKLMSGEIEVPIEG